MKKNRITLVLVLAISSVTLRAQNNPGAPANSNSQISAPDAAAVPQGKHEDTEVNEPLPRVVMPGKTFSNAPADALILFDGKTLDQWETSRERTAPTWLVSEGITTLTKEGRGAIQTKRAFRNYQMHIEYRIPTDITGEGQNRGNSGVFLASTGGGDAGYEMQILDSYDNENKTYVNGMNASLYKQYAPLANPAKKAGEWNAFDIAWSAPTFHEDGTVKTPAKATVLLNGVLVHNNVEMKGETVYVGQPTYKKYEAAPIRIQDHGANLSFRNIWIRETVPSEYYATMSASTLQGMLTPLEPVFLPAPPPPAPRAGGPGAPGGTRAGGPGAAGPRGAGFGPRGNHAETETWTPVPPLVKAGATYNDAPSDAVILFDGKNLNQWEGAKDKAPAAWTLSKGVLTIDKSKKQTLQTKRLFANFQLHIEWRVPANISGEGQARGNSGLYLASAGSGYEVQILDSYNNENKTYVNGMSGSIYKQFIPLVNPQRKNGEWNVYDIAWIAPRFNADGSVRSNARVTVFFNGVLVQNNAELVGETLYVGKPSYSTAYEASPIRLQSHGDPSEPISFKNIWIREL